MLGLGNILTRGSNPVEPFTGAIVSRWPARGSGYGVTYLPDTVGTNHINTTLGQALDFDGVNDSATSNYALGELMLGITTPITIGAIFRKGTVFSGSRCGIYGGTRASGPIGLYCESTNVVYTLVSCLCDVAGTPTRVTSSFVTFPGLVITDNTWYSIIVTYTPTIGSSNVIADITLTNIITGVVTKYTNTCVLSGGTFLSFQGYGSSASDAIGCWSSVNGSLWASGKFFSGIIGVGAVSHSVVHTALLNAQITGSEVNALFSGGRCYAHYVDAGSGNTITERTGNNYGHTPNITITADYATMWLNGTHLPSIPQKGYGGGNYTGGVGVAALYSFDVGDDTDPGCGISTASMDTLGDTFTFEMWIYKIADDGADGMCFVSTVDDAVAAADSRGFMLRNGMVGRTQALTDLQLELHGATAEDYTAVVTLGATGWWYCAFSLSEGTATLYAVKATGSSFESIASAAVGSLTVVDAGGDNRLTIMHRVGSVAGQTQDNCLAGTRVEALVYHAGVALTEAQLLERFNYSKSRYL